jgi:hypothetical protein
MTVMSEIGFVQYTCLLGVIGSRHAGMYLGVGIHRLIIT